MSPPLCRDCRHFGAAPDLHCKLVPELVEPGDFVTGRREKNIRTSCYWQRQQGWVTARARGACGREGRWFEPREPA